MALHLIELRLDPARLMRFLQAHGLLHDEELGYGVHAWLGAAFGKLAPKPWRLFFSERKAGRPPRILGYSRVPAEGLCEYLRAFAPPEAAAVCASEDIASKLMPTFASGQRLGFEVLACPVGRQARTGREKDVFLLHLDGSGMGGDVLTREAVYCRWASERLEGNCAATVLSVTVAGFHLARLLRQPRGVAGGRQRASLLRLRVVLRGDLRVGEPEAFSHLLERGLGRHRAFGYGMILLRPPS